MIRKAAEQLEQAGNRGGKKGDLAHINDLEALVLSLVSGQEQNPHTGITDFRATPKDMAEERLEDLLQKPEFRALLNMQGPGAGTKNPETGLTEYYGGMGGSGARGGEANGSAPGGSGPGNGNDGGGHSGGHAPSDPSVGFGGPAPGADFSGPAPDVSMGHAPSDPSVGFGGTPGVSFGSTKGHPALDQRTEEEIAEDVERAFSEEEQGLVEDVAEEATGFLEGLVDEVESLFGEETEEGVMANIDTFSKLAPVNMVERGFIDSIEDYGTMNAVERGLAVVDHHAQEQSTTSEALDGLFGLLGPITPDMMRSVAKTVGPAITSTIEDTFGVEAGPVSEGFADGTDQGGDGGDGGDGADGRSMEDVVYKVLEETQKAAEEKNWEDENITFAGPWGAADKADRTGTPLDRALEYDTGPRSWNDVLREATAPAETVITDAYDDNFDRAPDEDGMTHWLANFDRPDFQDDFLAGATGSDRGMTLDSMYQEMLGRQADADGHEYWMNAPDFGHTLDAFLPAASQEDRETHLSQIYQELFGRDIDDAGLEFWSGDAWGRGLADDGRIIDDILRSASGDDKSRALRMGNF